MYIWKQKFRRQSKSIVFHAVTPVNHKFHPKNYANLFFMSCIFFLSRCMDCFSRTCNLSSTSWAPLKVDEDVLFVKTYITMTASNNMVFFHPYHETNLVLGPWIFSRFYLRRYFNGTRIMKKDWLPPQTFSLTYTNYITCLPFQTAFYALWWHIWSKPI